MRDPASPLPQPGRPILLGLAAVLAALGGCSQAEEATPITINAATDNGTATVAAMDRDGRLRIDTPVLKAELKLPRIAVDAGDLDLDGMSLFPGSRIAGIAVEGDRGDGDQAAAKGQVRISFDAPAGPDAVRNWFVEETRRAQFNVQADGAALVGTTADGSPVRLEFATGEVPGRTRGVVTITER